VWAPFGDTPLTAFGIAAALELCGTGSVWVMEASIQRPSRGPATAPTAARAQAAMQMA